MEAKKTDLVIMLFQTLGGNLYVRWLLTIASSLIGTQVACQARKVSKLDCHGRANESSSCLGKSIWISSSRKTTGCGRERKELLANTKCVVSACSLFAGLTQTGRLSFSTEGIPVTQHMQSSLRFSKYHFLSYNYIMGLDTANF